MSSRGDVTEGLIMIEIPGVPQPQGSKRHVGGGRMIEDNQNLQAWRDMAVLKTKQRRERWWPIMGAVEVQATFILPRPKVHYGTGKNEGQVRPSAPSLHRSKPDLDKLLRALFDALTLGGLWYDDAQACKIIAAKQYGADPMTAVRIS